MNQQKIPIVALVGQANVGKSSLFNILVKSRQNIVAREAGTTRDSISQLVQLTPKKVSWLVDTAGLKNPEDEFETTIQDQITIAIDSADIICLLVESNRILNQDDRYLAKMALKGKKKIILVVNKVDLNLSAQVTDFLKLGIKDIVLTSATTRQGIPDLIQHLSTWLPDKVISADPLLTKVAILGRPNVGKSALFNSLAKKQQAIVSEKAGTTRDINRQKIRFEKHTIEFLDTAGIRRSGKPQVGVEKFSILRTLSAIAESDICLLLIDVNELATAVEQKIAGHVKEAGKGLVIVVSKWDTLADKDAWSADKIKAKIKHEFDFTPWASLIFTSSQTGQNVAKIFELILEIKQKRQQTIATSQLNQCLQQAMLKHLPAGLKNTRPKLNYVVQINRNPPTFQFFGSWVRYIHWSYKRFLERQIRETFDYQGTAIKLIFKEKH